MNRESISQKPFCPWKFVSESYKYVFSRWCTSIITWNYRMQLPALRPVNDALLEFSRGIVWRMVCTFGKLRKSLQLAYRFWAKAGTFWTPTLWVLISWLKPRDFDSVCGGIRGWIAWMVDPPRATLVVADDYATSTLAALHIQGSYVICVISPQIRKLQMPWIASRSSVKRIRSESSGNLLQFARDQRTNICKCCLPKVGHSCNASDHERSP